MVVLVSKVDSVCGSILIMWVWFLWEMVRRFWSCWFGVFLRVLGGINRLRSC